MLIIALVLALIGLMALVFAVVTSNELVAWACIAASALGVVLLIIDALRERQRRDAGVQSDDEAGAGADAGADEEALEYPEEVPDEGGQGAKASEEASTDASDESAVPVEGRSEDSAH